MHIAILAASGKTGSHLTRLALERGHTVTALARDPARLDLPDSPRLHRAAADVHDPASIAHALDGVDVVASGLGNTKGGPPGTLTAGANALIGAHRLRIVWLGAFGTGRSAAAAGPVTARLLSVVLRSEISDKTEADGAVLDAGGTVFHAGPLTNKPISTTYRTVLLADAPRHVLPRPISRATVAAAMIEEAESGLFAGRLVIPLR